MQKYRNSTEKYRLPTFVFICLGYLGLLSSFCVHLLTYWGINPEFKFPLIGILHIGAFLTFGLALYSADRIFNKKEDIFSGEFFPKWLLVIEGLFLVYALFNFFFTSVYLNKGGVPGFIDGYYVLHNHGHIIENLTIGEYTTHKAYLTRGFSGHWMFFYMGSILIIYAYIKKAKIRK
jgi:hypothetical protein